MHHLRYALGRGNYVKTVSVRIEEEQARRLQEIAAGFPGSSINGLVRRGVELFLEIEAPVYEAAIREARQKLGRKNGRLPASECVTHLSQGA